MKKTGENIRLGISGGITNGNMDTELHVHRTLEMTQEALSKIMHVVRGMLPRRDIL